MCSPRQMLTGIEMKMKLLLHKLCKVKIGYGIIEYRDDRENVDKDFKNAKACKGQLKTF